MRKLISKKRPVGGWPKPKKKQRVVKPRHVAALALVVWFIIEAPTRPCVGPADPRLSHDCLYSRTQCFDTGAALSKWRRIVGDFESAAECGTRLYALSGVSPQWHGSPIFACQALMCVSADDRRLAK
jgi:hypothetical protein